MQLWAIISDTYRSLRSRGLFWVILSISLTLGIAFASLGCDATGWFFLFGAVHFDSTYLVHGSTFESSLLINVLHSILDNWCMIGASLLTLMAAATIFPDAMQPGAIDLLLSKPVSRFKLFLGKYLAALLLVALQTLLLVVICFLSLLWRLHTPYWGLFWTVGLVVLIFSFIYCFTTWVGVLTRSSMASLLWTILFWFALWCVQFVEFKSEEMQAPELGTVLSAEVTSGASRMHDIMEIAMHVLPRTRRTGEIFTHVIHADAPHSLVEIFFHSKTPDQKLPQPAAPPLIWETIRSGVIFQVVLLGLAYGSFRRRDF